MDTIVELPLPVSKWKSIWKIRRPVLPLLKTNSNMIYRETANPNVKGADGSVGNTVTIRTQASDC